MSILKTIEGDFYFTANKIDKTITRFLIRRLGINNINTINALGLKEGADMDKRLHLLTQLKYMSESSKSKLEIYTQIYTAFITNAIVDENYFAKLVEFYPQQSNNLTPKNKVIKILKEFIEDVQKIVHQVTAPTIIQVVDEKNRKIKEFSLRD